MRIAVNIAASSTIEDEGNVVTNADKKETIGEYGFVYSQAILILIEGMPKPMRKSSVWNSNVWQQKTVAKELVVLD
ncbi:12366_t:CDS:1, partial [Funneliformis caledonium]